MTAPAIMPADMDGVALALGADVDKLPDYASLPREYQRMSAPWCDFVSGWFYRGVEKEAVAALKAVPGVDKNKALRHLSACLRSWASKHEHKIGGCGYLASLWFEGEPPKRTPEASR